MAKLAQYAVTLSGAESGSGAAFSPESARAYGDRLLETLASSAPTPLVPAPSQQDIDWCDGILGTTPDQRISGCSIVIFAGLLSGKFPIVWSDAMGVIGQSLAIVFHNRGNAYADKGDWNDATADYTEAIGLDPNAGTAFSDRGYAYYRNGLDILAVGDYAQAIRLAPNDANAYNGLGDAYADGGNWEDALAAYTSAIELNPNFGHALENRCWVGVVVDRDLPQALTDCNQALRLLGKNAETLDYRGYAYLELSKTDDAITDFDAALTLNPRLASALYGRGLAERAEGDTVDADTDIAAAKAIQANIVEEYSRYGFK